MLQLKKLIKRFKEEAFIIERVHIGCGECCVDFIFEAKRENKQTEYRNKHACSIRSQSINTCCIKVHGQYSTPSTLVDSKDMDTVKMMDMDTNRYVAMGMGKK